MFFRLFKAIDENGDGYLSAAELKALIVGIQFEELDLDEDDAVTKIMNDFDSSKDFKLDLSEFTEGVTRWLNHAINTGAASAGGNVSTIKYLDFAHHVSFLALNIQSISHQPMTDNEIQVVLMELRNG